MHRTKRENMTQEVETNDAQTEQPMTPELDVSTLMARLEKLESTNARILEESKSHKSKYQGLKSSVEEKEKAQLTENEQWKELLEMEKNKSSEFESRLRDQSKMTLKKEINFKVATLAGDAHDVNDIISALPKDLISINEEELSVNGIDEAVNSVRDSKPWLFKQESKSGMASGRPVVDNSAVDDLLTNEEKLAKSLEGFV